MKKIQRFSVVDLLLSIVVLIIGIILINNSPFLIKIVAWIISGILGIVGAVNIFRYIFKRNVGVDSRTLISGIVLVCFGIVLSNMPFLLDYFIRFLFGSLIIFFGVNRLIFAFTIGKLDQVGYKTFLITSIIMIVSGIIILISFYELLGILLVVYSIVEVVNYIYYNTHKQKYSTIFDVDDNDSYKSKDDNKKKKIKQEIKEKEAIEAVID